MRRVPTGIAALVLGSALLLACGNGDKGGNGGARDDRRDHRGKQRAYTLLDGRYTPIPEREGGGGGCFAGAGVTQCLAFTLSFDSPGRRERGLRSEPRCPPPAVERNRHFVPELP